MNIIVKDIRFEYEKLYADGILYQTIISGISIDAIVTIKNITIEGNFKFGYGILNDNSSIEDYKNAIKNLFKGE